MAVDGTRTLRGALAGALAAGVWAAQQPLDKRAFGVDYDDAALLGRFVARGRWANLAPRLPLPAWARGPAAGLAEHLATWPATCVLARVPAGRELPQLWGSSRAFAQATWRHVLFGMVLGELERRMNAEDEDADAHAVTVYSSNGHGSVEHLAATG
jgi:hypothetical protein